MKRFVFLLTVTLLGIVTVVAGKKDESYKVIVTLKNGTVINGYIRSSLMDGAMKVSVSETPNGKSTTYPSADIKTLVYPPNDQDQSTITYVPSRAKKSVASLWGKGKEFKAPVMLRIIYEGKNITGYTLTCIDATATRNRVVYRNAYKYYFKKKGEEVAIPYYYDIGGITIGLKSSLKKVFADYPGVIKAIEQDDSAVKDVKSDPATMLPFIDAHINEQ